MVPASQDALRKDYKSSSRKFLARLGAARENLNISREQGIFKQGDVADAVFYIQQGEVKLTIASKAGKEVTLGILGKQDFFGEAVLAGQTLRMGSALAVTDCQILRIEKAGMIEALRRERAFAKAFVAYLLTRIIRFEQRLWDQLFHPARTNWFASAREKEGGCKPSIAKENPGDAG